MRPHVPNLSSIVSLAFQRDYAPFIHSTKFEARCFALWLTNFGLDADNHFGARIFEARATLVRHEVSPIPLWLCSENNLRLFTHRESPSHRNVQRLRVIILITHCIPPPPLSSGVHMFEYSRRWLISAKKFIHAIVTRESVINSNRLKKKARAKRTCVAK